MHPRQASGVPSAGASDVIIPTSSAIDATFQLSAVTSTTDVASDSVSSSTSPASLSISADLTTTTSSSSTTTTSTSSSPSTTPPSITSSVAPTTSYTPASTSSSLLATSLLTSTTSASVPSSSTTTTEPPTSSLSQGTPTTITTAYTTYVNGSPVLTATAFPSTIPDLSAPSSSERTAIIAGSAAGGTALLILLLSLAFCARRRRFKRLDFLDTITLKRKQARSRATLLDGEDLDVGPPPLGYTDYATPWDAQKRVPVMVGRAGGTPGTPAAARLSETRSEDVLLPPDEGTRLMDPFTHKNDVEGDLDLGRIVDDVMGPSPSAAHFSGRSVSSMHRASMVESEGVHTRTVSNASNGALLEAAGLGAGAGMDASGGSNMALLEAAGLNRTAGTSTAPVRSSPLAQQGTDSASVTHLGGNMF